MKILVLLASICMLSSTAHADLMDDLRSIRGTISEATQTTKEAVQTGKEVGVLTNQQSTPAQTPQGKTAVGELKEGDLLRGKINKLKIYKEPSKTSKIAATVSKDEELVFMGEAANGFYRITSSSAEGWVEKLLTKAP